MTTEPVSHTDASAELPIDLSIVIPVYKNAESLPELCAQLDDVARSSGRTEVIFVVDGSPDNSLDVLMDVAHDRPYAVSIIELSRNFGSFAAIRTGLESARGRFTAVISADLQERPALVLDLVRALSDTDCDIALGHRTSRDDPLMTRLTSAVFWRLYRRLVQPQMPEGGVDVFACTDQVRRELVGMRESHSSLVGQLLWIGYETTTVDYVRHAREHGKSSWTLKKKLRYMSDSIFAFSDLPIRALIAIGLAGSVAMLLTGTVVAAFWLFGAIDVQGYTPLMLSILFIGFVLVLALGIVGSYVWRTYENSKARPLNLIRRTARRDARHT